MTLGQWGIVAEIIASLAVLVSLWFLVVELRRSLTQSKKQAAENLSLRCPGVRAWWRTRPEGFTVSFSALVNEEMARLEPAVANAQFIGSAFSAAYPPDAEGAASPER